AEGPVPPPRPRTATRTATPPLPFRRSSGPSWRASRGWGVRRGAAKEPVASIHGLAGRDREGGGPRLHSRPRDLARPALTQGRVENGLATTYSVLVADRWRGKRVRGRVSLRLATRAPNEQEEREAPLFGLSPTSLPRGLARG